MSQDPETRGPRSTSRETGFSSSSSRQVLLVPSSCEADSHASIRAARPPTIRPYPWHLDSVVTPQCLRGKSWSSIQGPASKGKAGATHWVRSGNARSGNGQHSATSPSLTRVGSAGRGEDKHASMSRPVLLVLCSIGLVGVLLRLWLIAFEHFFNEDALITLRYGRNIIQGNGWVYNTNQHVLGSTSPVWTVVGALASGLLSTGGARLLLSTMDLVFYCLAGWLLVRRICSHSDVGAVRAGRACGRFGIPPIDTGHIDRRPRRVPFRPARRRCRSGGGAIGARRLRPGGYCHTCEARRTGTRRSRCF